jgi:hypothetical protein
MVIRAEPIPTRTLADLRWSGKRATANRARRSLLARERDAMLGQLEAELVIRHGRSLTAIERSLVMTFVGTMMTLADLDRRVVRGIVIDHKAYASITSNLIKLAARLGVDRPTSRANAKPAEVNVTSLSDYLNSKSSASSAAEPESISKTPSSSTVELEPISDDDEAGDDYLAGKGGGENRLPEKAGCPDGSAFSGSRSLPDDEAADDA